MKRNKSAPFMPDAEWLKLVEYLIVRYSTPPRTRGKYKGHSSTDMLRWVWHLANVCEGYIRKRSGRRKAYDGNMALASLLGRVLVLWYCNVHRAKGFDPNRPLSRKRVFTQLAKYKGRLVAAIGDERLMGAVWGKKQQWNFPFGKGAKGGEFV